jgi:AAA domain
MQIKTNDASSRPDRVTSLSLGDSGKGKTFFTGTICDHGKPFIVDAEGGLGTISNKKFDYCTVNTWHELREACAWYYNNYREKGYTHLVVDSITRAQQYLANDVSKDGKLSQQQWGEILIHLRTLVDKLTKTCPTSLHITAMAMESKDELTGGIKIYPNIQGSFRYDLAGYFDIVVYHHCGEKDGKQQYWIQTQGDERILARSRYQQLKELKKYEKNDYGIIADIINKGEK